MNRDSENVNVETNQEMNVMIPTPSVAEIEKCKIEKGYREKHQIRTVKRSVTSKKWKDRGGGRGFGWVSQKVVKYLCEPGVESRKAHSISNNSEKSRNLDTEPGCSDVNLTRVDGGRKTSDVGIRESYNIHEQADIQTGRLNCGEPKEM